MTVIEGTLNGTVSEGDNFVKLNNHKDKALYDLTITKTISGTDVSKDDIFTFKLTLSDKLEGTYGDLLFKEGVSIFTLKADESKTAKQIEEGVIYDIEELDAEEYIQTVNENLSGIIAENTKVTINNHKDKKLGNLVLKKTASGIDVDVNTKFSFKITLSNKINKDFGNIVFENGIANVQLKPNESIEIIGLEEGTEYIIEETTKGYDSSVTKGNLNGKIAEGMNEVTVNNHRDKIEVPVGDIIITKTISGDGLTADDIFKFKLTLSEKLNGKYGDLTFKDGVSEFVMKANEIKKIMDLQVGTTYQLSEIDGKGADLKLVRGSMNGTVSNGDIQIEINNHKDKQPEDIVIKQDNTGTKSDSTQDKTTITEDLIDIKDEQTPQASPNIQKPSQTGDDAPIGILVLLLFTSGICSMFCLKRKKK